MLPLLFAASLFGQSSWSNAAFIALSGSAESASARTLYYLDSYGSILGSQTLADSAYAGANSIAYGTNVCPNLSGADGLMLLRTKNGAATMATQSAARDVNFYPDPLDASGGTLSKMTVGSGTFIGPNNANLVDSYLDLSVCADGRVYSLISRQTTTTTQYYLYAFLVPGASAGAPSMSRNTTSGTNGGYFQIGDSTIYTSPIQFFTMGNFYADSTRPYQFAFVDSAGMLYVRDFENTNASTYAKTSFSVAQADKSILSIWETDDNLIGILYDDNSVIAWNASTMAQEYGYELDEALTGVLDIIQIAAYTPIPEPAHLAALIGLGALLFALKRRRNNKA